ncbi:Acetyltransferase (GNAT) family protein [Bacillus sp. OV322]|uniref:GNAT family N-acetyltransferase n=1 Tax=Bacillus sp. OV322 TaxID=1882764 RepID=UPI0008E8C367|nr:GNAT family N-acetyltransferase [Bacillus sp. OV322]SFC66658.1 Acetyltransferase (GNAT) family protein [Bacillus sp. OV322]
MNISSTKDVAQEKITEFFKLHWGSTKMVISSGVYDCCELEGFSFLNNEEIEGLITYKIMNNECEIISLDSLKEGRGIGTALVQQVEKFALENNCKVLKLVTTNDNLNALKFYQKRGFILSRIINNAVEAARRIKPQIPKKGLFDIPLRDEIELKKFLI